MRTQSWRNRLLAISVAGALLAVPWTIEASPQGLGKARVPEGVRRSEMPSGRIQAGTRIYQDPATANGYEDGYDLGLSDGRSGQRYDPVRHREYRNADRGYDDSYGPKDGYRKNYRTGFRQGYEDGYREAARGRR